MDCVPLRTENFIASFGGRLSAAMGGNTLCRDYFPERDGL